MKASSLGLAAVLAVVAFNSASAGFSRGPFRHGFAPSAPFAHAHGNPPAIGRFGPFGPNNFRHDWDRFAPILPAYFPFPSPSPDDAPSGTADAAPAPTVNAPSYSTTIVMAAPQYVYAPAPAFATSGGPKIITIGAPAHASHWRKTPIVIYGATRVGGTY